MLTVVNLRVPTEEETTETGVDEDKGHSTLTQFLPSKLTFTSMVRILRDSWDAYQLNPILFGSLAKRRLYQRWDRTLIVEPFTLKLLHHNFQPIPSMFIFTQHNLINFLHTRRA
jgi:hypothetical protein